MTKTQKATITAVATLLLFLLLGWLLPPALHIASAGRLWTLRAGLWLLGAVAALLVFLVLRGKKGAQAEPEGKDEIDVAIAAAKARLGSARGKATAQFGRLPIMLIAGPSSAAKTTVIARSGLNPDLLAGEVMRGDAVPPTASVNVWYAQGNLIVEAGGRVTNDGKAWHKLIRYIQPNRLGAVLSRKEQAPRVAVVCFGCDELLKPGASESVPGHAQRLRARLAEVAQQLGIRLPVYVLFTKADRLPYFEDYVRSFTREEARDVLGATLTVPQAGNVGHYAERETRRIANAFSNVFQGLALRRLDLLPRETQELVKAGAYEFPREFRKVTDLASLFLLELCRPNQLGVSPFLRGFYFTGVRPILVNDVAAPVPELQARVPAGGSAVDATQVFDPRKLYQQQAPQPVAQTGARKVPEWVFLERFFKDVVLRDAVARSVTAGGTKVALGRRILLGAASAALVVLSLGMFVSFLYNKSLLGNTRDAIADARSLINGGLADQDALQRLDRLRQQSALLNQHAREGDKKLRYRWFLYAGDKVQPNVRLVYFRAFDGLLGTPARGQLGDWLAKLPPTPGSNDDFDGTYNALKAYLVTTSEADSARRDFLTPELMRFWAMAGEVDAAREPLLKAQFDFYGDELPFREIDQPVNGDLVQRTQAFLHQFRDEAQLYNQLLIRARGQGAPVRWAGTVVQNERVVPAEFTAPGWQRAQDALANVQQLLAREPWVMGQSVLPARERAQAERMLRERYKRDYVAAWSDFLRVARVPPLGDPGSVANRLTQLTNNASPLLQMIALAANNTAVDDSLGVRKVFEPVHTVAAPNATAPTEAAKSYIAALGPLQVALAKISADPSQAVAFRAEADLGAGQARAAVNEVALNFSTQGDARAVGEAVRRLLLEPIENAENVVRHGPSAAINGKASGFCAPLATLGRKFPFNRETRTDASVAELKEVLAPGTGRFWASYQNDFPNLLSKRGSQYGPGQGGPEPTDAFLRYFNAVAQISEGLFATNSDRPQVLFTLRMTANNTVRRIIVNMGGRERTYTQVAADDETFEWDGAALPAKITGEVNGRLEPIIDLGNDQWWLFRLLAAGQVEPRGNGAYQVTWRRGQISVSGDLTLETNSNFHPELFPRLANCPGTLAR